jgi:AraC-like DNA-binding protein
MPDGCSVLPRNILQFTRREQPRPEVSFHHRFVMIAALREGGGVILDGEVFRVEPGQGVLIFPFQSHHFTPFAHPRNVRWLFTTFEHADPGMLEPLRNTPFTLEPRDAERLQALTGVFLSWRAKGDAPVPEAAPLLALLLTGLVARQRRYLKRVGGAPGAIEGPATFVARISRHVYANLGRGIPIRELAGVAALSPSRLRARFREALGIPLGLFIRRTRIHRACGLLHSTGKNVSEVAAACGFESLYSFSRAFKQVMGQSPRAYRAGLSGVRTQRHDSAGGPSRSRRERQRRSR